MTAPLGNYIGLNLGPLYAGPGNYVPLNLGVDWSDETEEPETDGSLHVARGVLWRAQVAVARKVVNSGWHAAPRRQSGTRMPWRRPPLVQRPLQLPWHAAPRVRQTLSLPWRTRLPGLHRGTDLAWRQLPTRHASAALRWQQLQALQRSVAQPWLHLPQRRTARDVPFRSQLPARQRGIRMQWLSLPLRNLGFRIPWGKSGRLPWALPEPEPETPPVDPPSPFPPGNYIGLDLGCPIIGIAGHVPLNLGVTACYAVRPRRRTYIVENTVDVIRIPDETPIAVSSVSISGDVGTWCYSMDMQLADASHLPLLKPTASGPREVRVTINGYAYTFIIESYSHNRQFGETGVSVSGRSRTALLATPYAPTRSKTATEALTMAQLVDAELADTGYTAVYDTVDWEVPAGAWYYDSLSPMDAIVRLAEASGAVVQSDPADKKIYLRPRYPVSPWDWVETTPDAIVQDDIVTSESLTVTSTPLYDAVVVTGEIEGKGVTARVKKSDEAATTYAQQASSPLINTNDAARERGRNILCDRGAQASVDKTLPLFAAPLASGETGRMLPLDLGELVETEGTWHGLCTSVRIESRSDNDAVVVEQTLTFERHYDDAD